MPTPTYVQIQTYTTCSRYTFPEVINRYREMLERLNEANQDVISWLEDLAWPHTEDEEYGDIYASPFELLQGNADTPPLRCEGLEVSLYEQAALLSVEEPPTWIGFTLLFDIKALRDDVTAPYPAEIGTRLWYVMQEIATSFQELGVYFTDEWQENRPWQALVETTDDPWTFDLAIFPRSLASHFEAVPAGFQGTVVEQGFGFAQENRWERLPWKS